MNDQIVKQVLGRMADEAPDPVDFSSLGAPVVRGARSAGRRRGLIAVGGLAGVIAIVVIGAFLISTRPDPTTPAGAPAVATANEFEAALRSALDTLASEPGVVGVEESRISEHLSSRVWWSARPIGDAVVVQQRDVDVADTAWWLTSEAPLRVGERIAITGWVSVNGTFLEAIESPSETQAWTERDAPRGPLAFGLGILYSADPALRDLWPPADLIRHWTEEDGTAVWELTGADEMGRWMQRFQIDSHGRLATWELQRVSGDADSASGLPPIDSSSLTFMPLDDPEPIEPPTASTALDLAAFDLPEGFLIGG